MNEKALYAAVAALGIMLLVLSAYQFNQYWSAKVVVEPSLEQFDELAELDAGTLASIGMDAASIQSSKQTVVAGLDALLHTALFDFVLGAALMFAGISKYPTK